MRGLFQTGVIGSRRRRDSLLTGLRSPEVFSPALAMVHPRWMISGPPPAINRGGASVSAPPRRPGRAGLRSKAPTACPADPQTLRQGDSVAPPAPTGTAASPGPSRLSSGATTPHPARRRTSPYSAELGLERSEKARADLGFFCVCAPLGSPGGGRVFRVGTIEGSREQQPEGGLVGRGGGWSLWFAGCAEGGPGEERALGSGQG